VGLAHPAGDELGVLGAVVDDEDRSVPRLAHAGEGRRGRDAVGGVVVTPG
jgi:hypothetical protein